MNTINNKFEKVVCINLANRPDKKKVVQQKFDANNISVEWYTAVQYGFAPAIVKALLDAKVSYFNISQPHEIGCALSHYSVIKQALEENVKTLFVFEDDICFHKNFIDKFDRSYEMLPENWDMIMLYSFMYEILPQNVRINSRWMKAYKSWSLMAYGMNRKMMEDYIKHQDKFFAVSDVVTYKMQEEGYNIFVSAPSLCVPNPRQESNIRSIKNYETNSTIINLGVSKDDYI